MSTPKHQEMLKALMCLSLEVPPSIAGDVEKKVLDRVTELQDALQDAIEGIRHSEHPVAMTWIPSLEKKLGR